MRKSTLALRLPFVIAFVLLVVTSPTMGAEIEVGATIRLIERLRPDGSDKGIPGHPAMGNRGVNVRLSSSSTAVVKTLGDDDHGNWIEVSANGRDTWIITKYVASVEPSSGDALTYVVGCWNLEHFGEGKKRGFPEGTSIPARTSDQVGMIATTIQSDLGASFLVLSEINGKSVEDEDGEEMSVSDELDLLVGKMSTGWTYIIASSGKSQRVAFLYDETKVRVNEAIEYEIARREIQGKDIFARDPLAAHVTLLENGQERNDLVIVGVHLASGQHNHKNHDAAMRKLLRLISESQEVGELGGESEHDILIMGDYNANMFRPPVERFFVDMDEPDSIWDVLAGDGYPPKRLSSTPLRLFRSQIDYIIASRKTQDHNGLSGDEIADPNARVHTELLQVRPPVQFRRDLSDHLPVTTRVRVTADSD